MAGASALQMPEPQLFPLETVESVVEIFRQQLSSNNPPNLALLSIIAGAVENSCTCNRSFSVDGGGGGGSDTKLPAVEYRIVMALYMKFHAVIKGSVDTSLYGDGKYATRELVKRVSDVIWNSLTRSYYKDRAHLQSLFSYLTGNKLDCFGVAFAVVAACQLLGYDDVHLALSEDHAWVVFGENGDQSAEVTWHGKGNEDKRGQPVDATSSRSWLYMNGWPVICTRELEVAALVSAINPSLSVSSDAIEVAVLQQDLLWLLYDLHHLEKYPMALGNLGDLEEISPTAERPLCSELFEEAILSAQRFYNNQHVYPYTYQAGFFYRHNMYKQAFASWANAADVIRKYNYTRDDEEIYKEFMEIANELIPHVIKVVSSGHSARSILKDAECFASLLRFYDGLCQWEEGSQTPILHIGWAKPFVHTISKFEPDVRAKVVIVEARESDENCNEMQPVRDDLRIQVNTTMTTTMNNNVDSCLTRELIRSLERDETNDGAPVSPKIAVLAAACSEKILNPRYLISGSDEPFVKGLITEEESKQLLSVETNLVTAGPSSLSPNTAPTSNKELLLKTLREEETVSEVLPVPEEDPHPRILLHSQKMIGLKDLLLAEKLNTHAISLQLTAQSQVAHVSRKRSTVFEERETVTVRPKRSRRD